MSGKGLQHRVSAHRPTASDFCHEIFHFDILSLNRTGEIIELQTGNFFQVGRLRIYGFHVAFGSLLVEVDWPDDVNVAHFMNI